MDLFAQPFCAHIAWTYMITILCSGCTDVYVIATLCSHGPIWSAFCTRVTWTYFACGNSQHRGTFDSELFLPFCTKTTWTYMITVLHSGHMDLYDCHFVNSQQRDFGFWVIFAILHSGHMDHDCHFALSCRDRYDWHSVLRLCRPIISLTTHDLHLNITMLPPAIPTNHSSPQCTHVLFTPFCKMWHYKY